MTNSTIRLYLPSIVLAAWALLWTTGVTDARIVGVFLTLVALSLIVAERERRVRCRERA